MAKQNPDYTKSAINLCNPPEVETILSEYGSIEDELLAEKTALADESFVRMEAIKVLTVRLTECKAKMLEAVKANGSYQDIEAGVYAVLARTISRDWDLAAVKELVDPRFHAACIVEAVDGEVIKSLIKGKQIPEGIVDRIYPVVKEGQQFIVRAFHEQAEVGNAD